MELTTKLDAVQQVDLLQADLANLLFDINAPLAADCASIDDAVRAAATSGWHVKRVDGYDPTLGGPPVYTWVFVSADGSAESPGTAYPLRLACLLALQGVLP